LPGQPTVTLNGTIQEVVSQLLDLNPDWTEDDFIFNSTDSEVETNRTAFNLTGRSPGDAIFRQKCFAPWTNAFSNDIGDGINYLYGLDSKLKNSPPGNGPGPGNCGRVSCSWESAIWWCNDASST